MKQELKGCLGPVGLERRAWTQVTPSKQGRAGMQDKHKREVGASMWRALRGFLAASWVMRMVVIAVCPIHLELVELREGGELRSSGSREELTEANRHRAFCEALWSQSSEACTYPQGRNNLHRTLLVVQFTVPLSPNYTGLEHYHFDSSLIASRFRIYHVLMVLL